MKIERLNQREDRLRHFDRLNQRLFLNIESENCLRNFLISLKECKANPIVNQRTKVRALDTLIVFSDGCLVDGIHQKTASDVFSIIRVAVEAGRIKENEQDQPDEQGIVVAVKVMWSGLKKLITTEDDDEKTPAHALKIDIDACDELPSAATGAAITLTERFTRLETLYDVVQKAHARCKTLVDREATENEDELRCRQQEYLRQQQVAESIIASHSIENLVVSEGAENTVKYSDHDGVHLFSIVARPNSELQVEFQQVVRQRFEGECPDVDADVVLAAIDKKTKEAASASMAGAWKAQSVALATFVGQIQASLIKINQCFGWGFGKTQYSSATTAGLFNWKKQTTTKTIAALQPTLQTLLNLEEAENADSAQDMYKNLSVLHRELCERIRTYSSRRKPETQDHYNELLTALETCLRVFHETSPAKADAVVLVGEAISLPEKEVSCFCFRRGARAEGS